MVYGQAFLSLGSTRQACFCSALNPQELSSRQRTMDWKGFDDEPRMVLCKHSNRPDQDCIYEFNLRLSQNANWVFFKFFLLVTFAGDVLFERNSPTANMQEATLCEQIDLRVFGKPAQKLKTRKRKNVSHFQLDKTILKFPKHTNADCRYDQSSAQQQTGNVEYYLVSHDDSEVHAARPKTRRQAKHMAAVVVCCRSPTRSRSRQSNESAVDSSCESLAFVIYR